jgi:hypothetical protein
VHTTTRERKKQNKENEKEGKKKPGNQKKERNNERKTRDIFFGKRQRRLPSVICLAKIRVLL